MANSPQTSFDSCFVNVFDTFQFSASKNLLQVSDDPDAVIDCDPKQGDASNPDGGVHLHSRNPKADHAARKGDGNLQEDNRATVILRNSR